MGWRRKLICSGFKDTVVNIPKEAQFEPYFQFKGVEPFKTHKIQTKDDKSDWKPKEFYLYQRLLTGEELKSNDN